MNNLYCIKAASGDNAGRVIGWLTDKSEQMVRDRVEMHGIDPATVAISLVLAEYGEGLALWLDEN